MSSMYSKPKPTFVCLHETKMAECLIAKVFSCLGREYSSRFWFLPADGTRGGILLSCRDSSYCTSHIIINTYTITTTVLDSKTQTL
jgi:hypothetical protein